MKLSDQIAEIVTQNKEVSTQITAFTERSITPPMLEQLMMLKHQEVTNFIEGVRKQPRSSIPGSKNHKTMEQKRKETEVNRKIRRFNIIDLLGKLFTALDGHRSQDVLVQLVSDAHKKYKASYKNSSKGLSHLLEQWGRMVQNRDGALVLLEEADENVRRQVALKEGQGLTWEKAKEPRNKLALRAVEQYNAMRQKKLEREFKEAVEEAKKKQRQDKLNQNAQKEVQRRGQVLEREQVQRRERMLAVLSVDGSTAESVQKRDHSIKIAGANDSIKRTGKLNPL